MGMNSQPVPKKLMEKIWKRDYVQLDKLLPANLGAPELTLVDLFGKNQERQDSTKKIKTIQQCFNAYISIIALKQHDRVRNLLTYSSLITKASADYQGSPWLTYNSHFRQMAAITKQSDWSQVNLSLWTQYFSNAKLAAGRDSGLTMIPMRISLRRVTKKGQSVEKKAT